MSLIRSKNTEPELFVRRVVHALGYRFRLHVRSLPGTPDVVLPRLRKIIEVRGCFWHMHNCGQGHVPMSRQSYWSPKLEGNKVRDRESLIALKRLGWTVLVVWECETTDFKRLTARLNHFLNRRG